MRYPDFLQENETIGFVSPSFGCSIEPYKSAFENAKSKFIDRGYKVDVGPNCYKNDGIGISSSPKKCGEEFMDYYIDKDNNCLISCGGGELMCEILDFIDFDKIKSSKPKWFMGYSDNTNLTFLLTTLCDVASIYGPCAATFGMEPWHPSLYDAMGIITGKITKVSNYEKWEKESLKNSENPLEPYNTTENFKLKKIPDANLDFSGRLLGGCVDCLVNILGTKYDKVEEFVHRYKKDGIVWFLESCELNVMDIRRAMWQMENAGWFKYSKGFIIGRPYQYGQELMGLDTYEAVIGIIGKYNVPIIMDADIGHLAPMMPLVSGSIAEIKSVRNAIEINMKYE